VTRHWTAEQDAAFRAAADGHLNGNGSEPLLPERDDWLTGSPMDPLGARTDPLPLLPGFSFLHGGTGVLISGPTGAGRSSLVQACAYDAARAGLRTCYLGFEITRAEFNVRAARLARLRGDVVDDVLRRDLALVRYVDLPAAIERAWAEPEEWAARVATAYQVVVVDPLSAVESALPLNFEQSNHDFVRFYDRIVQPITSRGVLVALIDNVGHAIDAKTRPKGASAKSDRADLTFSCALHAEPPGLVIRAHKVRIVRAAFRRGDEWLFVRDTQEIERRASADDAGAFRPTVLMEKVSRVVEEQPGATLNTIKRSVSGKREYLTAAIERLVAEGFAERRQDGQARRHFVLRPYREADENTPGQPGPGRRVPVPDDGSDSAPQTAEDRGPENPRIYGGSEPRPTEAQPRPNRGPAPVATTEAPRPVYVVPGTRASVGDESQAGGPERPPADLDALTETRAAGLADATLRQARAVRCCCVHGGAPGRDGRCERCYGSVAGSL
jgi:hypothetical protein